MISNYGVYLSNSGITNDKWFLLNIIIKATYRLLMNLKAIIDRCHSNNGSFETVKTLSASAPISAPLWISPQWTRKRTLSPFGRHGGGGSGGGGDGRPPG